MLPFYLGWKLPGDRWPRSLLPIFFTILEENSSYQRYSARLDSTLCYANRESERSFVYIDYRRTQNGLRYEISWAQNRPRFLAITSSPLEMRAVRNVRTVHILLDLYFSSRLCESRSTIYRESKTRHGACHLARNFVPRAMMQQTTRTLNCIRILWAQHHDSLACSSSSSHFAQRDTSLDLSIYRDREHSLHEYSCIHGIQAENLNKNKGKTNRSEKLRENKRKIEKKEKIQGSLHSFWENKRENVKQRF